MYTRVSSTHVRPGLVARLALLAPLALCALACSSSGEDTATEPEPTVSATPSLTPMTPTPAVTPTPSMPPAYEEVNLADADVRLLGGADTFDLVGWAVSSAGDINGDGYDDVIVGAPWESAEADYTGAAYIIYGPQVGDIDLDDADATIRGAFEDMNLGQTVAGVGDVNGDGFDDVLVGVYQAAFSGVGRGAAYLFFGPLEGEVDIEQADVHFVPEQAGAVESRVAAAGDVNGDGFDDILISTPYQPHGEFIEAGAVYLVLGPTSGDMNLAEANARIQGTASELEVGFAVAAAGDINDDGNDDVLVAAWSDGSSSEATAYLFHGPFSGETALSDADASFAGLQGANRVQLAAPRPSISAAGDVNGDGKADLALGAPGRHRTEGEVFIEGEGEVYIFHGPVSGALNAVEDADATLFHDHDHSYIGEVVSSAGDFNGDGVDDLLISDRDGVSGSVDGVVYLVLGPVSGEVDLRSSSYLFVGESDSQSAGHSASYAGDYNGDGLSDILIGAPSFTSAEFDRAYIILGR